MPHSMGMRGEHGDLQVDEDLAYERREWRFQRVGWAVMALILLAALLGIFGVGPLSAGEVKSGDGRLAVAYHRFLRLGTATDLEVRARADRAPLRIWVDRRYLSRFNLLAVVPEPEQVALTGTRAIYTFAGTPERELAVTWEVDPARVGSARGRLGIVGGSEMRFRQFTWP